MTAQGLMCPACQCPLAPIERGQRSVYYTRNGVRCIMRRRVCWNCNRRFTTEERILGDIPLPLNFDAPQDPSSTSGTF